MKPAGGGPTGTIALVTAAPAYHAPIVLDWAVEGKFAGFYYPMIYLAAYQDGNPYAYEGLDGLVYGMLDRPAGESSGEYTTILGAGSSAWVQNGGGPARCTATLYLYPGMHDKPIVRLAEIAFEAAG